jgi:hypothetical protein
MGLVSGLDSVKQSRWFDVYDPISSEALLRSLSSAVEVSFDLVARQLCYSGGHVCEAVVVASVQQTRTSWSIGIYRAQVSFERLNGGCSVQHCE